MNATPRVWVTDRKVLILWPGTDEWRTVARQPDGRCMLGYNPRMEPGAVEMEMPKEDRQ